MDLILSFAGYVSAGKHGTCSYPLIQDEYSYFSKALELYFKYNITVSLGESLQS